MGKLDKYWVTVCVSISQLNTFQHECQLTLACRGGSYLQIAVPEVLRSPADLKGTWLFGQIFIFCKFKLIFGRLTCFDMKNIVL